MSAIDYALEHPEEARKMGNTAHASIAERFSIDSVVDKYDKLYKALG